jgi:thiamine kinase-like enzyme
VWDERETFLSWIERAPRTVCHLDLWPRNVFDDDGATVLIDWAFVGIGAVGEDVGNLVPDAV